ncbi:hypothetical protein ACL02T_09910 [Pseudonocardia sp. RS010]|uniref:hypothetical protein n=1 Tax=Pseudonocardia sp. RS010 TaxID=3385979 RepID=UPI0039A16F14
MMERPQGPPAPAPGPAETTPRPAASIDELLHPFAALLRESAGEHQVDYADVEPVVDTAAGLVAAGRAAEARHAAAEAGAGLARMAELDLPNVASRPQDWSGFGAVLPVLAGSPGAGASALAAAMADALQLAARCVLLIDAADPARSGLAGAASAEGPWLSPVSDQVAIRYSWRGHALLARLESPLPVITPSQVPPPPQWLPEVDPLHVTVVDIGHDGWRTTANPLLGAGGWLRRGTPAPRPILVVRPTRPSLRHAEQVLARLDPWISRGVALPPFQLAVTGAKRWPGGVTGAAGRRLDPLLDDALFIPHDSELEIGGVTDELVPDKVLAVVCPLLADWGLLPELGRSRSRKARR